MTVSEIMSALAEHVEQLEADNKRLMARVAELEGRRLQYGQLDSLPDVLTAQEIAKFLRIHRDTVYEMFRVGKIPSFGGGAQGKSLRCMKQDFIDWLSSQRAGRPVETEAVPIHVVKGQRRKKVV